MEHELKSSQDNGPRIKMEKVIRSMTRKDPDNKGAYHDKMTYMFRRVKGVDGASAAENGPP